MKKLHSNMKRELELFNYSSNTQKTYLAYAEDFANFFKKSPEKL